MELYTRLACSEFEFIKTAGQTTCAGEFTGVGEITVCLGG